jgi:hypothetical protein
MFQKFVERNRGNGVYYTLFHTADLVRRQRLFEGEKDHLAASRMTGAETGIL